MIFTKTCYFPVCRGWNDRMQNPLLSSRKGGCGDPQACWNAGFGEEKNEKTEMGPVSDPTNAFITDWDVPIEKQDYVLDRNTNLDFIVDWVN